jgi:hypothetical protein
MPASVRARSASPRRNGTFDPKTASGWVDIDVSLARQGVGAGSGAQVGADRVGSPVGIGQLFMHAAPGMHRSCTHGGSIGSPQLSTQVPSSMDAGSRCDAALQLPCPSVAVTAIDTE